MKVLKKIQYWYQACTLKLENLIWIPIGMCKSWQGLGLHAKVIGYHGRLESKSKLKSSGKL
jgi:hypothetical protein